HCNQSPVGRTSNRDSGEDFRIHQNTARSERYWITVRKVRQHSDAGLRPYGSSRDSRPGEGRLAVGPTPTRGWTASAGSAIGYAPRVELTSVISNHSIQLLSGKGSIWQGFYPESVSKVNPTGGVSKRTELRPTFG